METASNFVWYLFGIILAVDLALSVSRSAFLDLGLIYRERTLQRIPLVGEWLSREGFPRASDRLLMTLQIAKQISLIVLVWVLYSGLSRFGPSFRLPVALALTLGFEIGIDQGVSRALAALHPRRAFHYTAPVLFPVYLFLFPLTGLVLALLSRFQSSSPVETGDPVEEVPEKIVQEYIAAGQREGILEKEEGLLVRSIVEFGDTLVREVMTPRTRMVAIEKKAGAKDLRQLVSRTPHSRFPVCNGTIDRIEGIIHIKDLLARWDEIGNNGNVTMLMRPASFVPETKKVAELLKDFQRERNHMSIVIDEFGGTTGLVTIEDLLEEIVGEIRDEHERMEDFFQQEAPGVYLIRGIAAIEKLNNLFHVSLDGDDFESVGGMVSAVLGHIPARGEILHHMGLRFEIVDADRKRIHQVRVRRISGSGNGPEK